MKKEEAPENQLGNVMKFVGVMFQCCMNFLQKCTIPMHFVCHDTGS
jgi:hypothetical protein